MNQLFSLFRSGLSLEKAETWHNRAALAAAFVGILMGVSYVCKTFFGVDLHLTNDDANAIAGGLATGACIVFNLLAARTARSSAAVSAQPAEPPRAEPAPVVQPHRGPDRNTEDTMRAGG